MNLRQPVKARIDFRTRTACENVTVGLGFSTLDGRRLLTYDTDFQAGFRPTLSQSGPFSGDVEIDALPLAPDIYTLDIGCRSGEFSGLDYVPSITEVEVVAGRSTPGYIVRKAAGVRLGSKWRWHHLT